MFGLCHIYNDIRKLIITVVSLGFTLPALAAPLEESVPTAANGNTRDFQSSLQFHPVGQVMPQDTTWRHGLRADPYRGEQMNLTLKSWNTEKSTTNVYLITGLGSERLFYNDRNGNRASLTGLQLDYEDDHLYTSAKFENFKNQDSYSYKQQELKVGYSPSPSNAKGGMKVWLMLMAQRITGIDGKLDFSPSLQLLDNSFKTELSVDSEGFMINAKYKW